MSRLSPLGLRVVAALLALIGFSTLARLLDEILKHNKDLRSPGTNEDGTAS